MRLETKRLLQRPIEMADLDAFVALHADPAVTQFVRPVDRNTAVERLRLAEREWQERGYGVAAVIERSTGRFVGRAGLKYWPQFGETELGWVLRRDSWGRGYATEAARACAQWGMSEFAMPCLTAMIQPDNVRSVRVAESLGMAPLRTDTLLGDPVVVYALGRDGSSCTPETGPTLRRRSTNRDPRNPAAISRRAELLDVDQSGSGDIHSLNSCCRNRWRAARKLVVRRTGSASS